MKPKLWCVVLVALCLLSAFAQFDEPVSADTLRPDTVSVWPDTVLAFSDSTTLRHVPVHHGWLYPLSIVMVTCMGFLMLFTMRSR